MSIYDASIQLTIEERYECRSGQACPITQTYMWSNQTSSEPLIEVYVRLEMAMGIPLELTL